MATEKKSSARVVKPASSQPSFGENLKKLVSKKEAEERAYYKYLALPDAAAIASHIRPANSAKKALKLIQDAEKEAERIRIEMVRSWDSGLIAAVLALLETRVGKLPNGVRSAHPIIGPFLRVYYEELVPKHQAEARGAAAARKEKQDTLEKALEAKAIAATKSREGALMVRCVKRYVEWAETEKKSICLKSASEFQTTERIKKERLTEFLCTLINGLNNSLCDEVILGILNDCKTMRRKRPKGKTWGEAEPEEVPEKHFENVELPAVAECMKTLRDAVQKKHEWTKLD